MVWNMNGLFSIQLGMSSSQLTFIFFRGVETTNQVYVCAQYVCMSIYRSIDRSIYLLAYIYIYKYVCVITCNVRACFKSIFVFMCLSVRKFTWWLFCFSMCGKDADEITADLQMSPWMEANGPYLIAFLRVHLLGQSTIVEIDRGI